MAQRVEAPSVTIPAGTTVAAPQTTALSWARGKLERLEIIVPPGPSGFVGFAVGHSGVVIIPRTAGQFIVADDQHFDWNMEDYPTGAKWFVRAYNTDIYDHTLQLIVHIREFGPVLIPSVNIVPIVQTVEQVVTE